MRVGPRMESLEPRLLLDAGPAAEATDRIIDFAGMQWSVLNVDTPAAEGENWYSDSAESVWVDADGLHLKIRSDGGIWYAAELVTVQSTVYGVHRFYVTGRPDLMDANVALDLGLVRRHVARGEFRLHAQW